MIFTVHTSNKELLSRIHKELLKITENVTQSIISPQRNGSCHATFIHPQQNGWNETDNAKFDKKQKLSEAACGKAFFYNS